MSEEIDVSERMKMAAAVNTDGGKTVEVQVQYNRYMTVRQEFMVEGIGRAVCGLGFMVTLPQVFSVCNNQELDITETLNEQVEASFSMEHGLSVSSTSETAGYTIDGWYLDVWQDRECRLAEEEPISRKLFERIIDEHREDFGDDPKLDSNSYAIKPLDGKEHPELNADQCSGLEDVSEPPLIPEDGEPATREEVGQLALAHEYYPAYTLEELRQNRRLANKVFTLLEERRNDRDRHLETEDKEELL